VNISKKKKKKKKRKDKERKKEKDIFKTACNEEIMLRFQGIKTRRGQLN
jgi:hypothetical protein